MHGVFRMVSIALVLSIWSDVPAQSPTTTTANTVQSLPAGPSVWKSQAGATLELDIDASGHVTGTLVTSVGCGPAASQGATAGPGAATAQSATTALSRAVAGSAVGNAVAWTVSFLPDCALVGAWAGRAEQVGTQEQLTMLWLLTMPETPPSFMSTFAGADVFVRQP